MEVAAFKSPRPYPCPASGLDIPKLVSNHQGFFEIHRPFGYGSKQHARIGFAIRGVWMTISKVCSFGMVGTIVEAIDPAADLLEGCCHLSMKRLYVILGVISAADSRLICHHKDQPAGAIKGTDRRLGPGHPAKILP